MWRERLRAGTPMPRARSVIHVLPPAPPLQSSPSFQQHQQRQQQLSWMLESAPQLAMVTPPPPPPESSCSEDLEDLDDQADGDEDDTHELDLMPLRPLPIPKSPDRRVGGDESEHVPAEVLAAEAHFAWGQRYRWLLLAVACFQSFWTTGTIYGWPALVRLMLAEGFYHYLCPADTPANCPEQEVRLGLMFTLASGSLLLSLFVMGLFLDRFGPKACCAAGCTVIALGAALFALSNAVLSNVVDFYLLGFTLMAFGGPSLHISFIHLSNLFGDRKATVISLLNGFFALSGYVFALFLGLESLFSVLTLQWLFTGYTALMVSFVVLSLVLWPSWPFVHVTPPVVVSPFDRPTESTPLLVSIKSGHDLEAMVADKQDEAAARYDPKRQWHKSFLRQLSTAEWPQNTIFMCVSILFLQFYLGSLPMQLVELGDDGTFAIIGNLIAPLGALGIPFYGWMIDKHGFAWSYLLVNLMGELFSAVALVPNLYIQLVTFLVWGMYRVFLFSCTFSFTAAVFGFNNFGKVNGLTLSLSGVAAQLQLVLAYVAQRLGSYRMVNVIALVARVPLFIFAIYLWRTKR